MENIKPKKISWVNQRRWAPACRITDNGTAIKMIRQGNNYVPVANTPYVAQTDAVLRRMLWPAVRTKSREEPEENQ
jgi:hypothetical protein